MSKRLKLKFETTEEVENEAEVEQVQETKQQRFFNVKDVRCNRSEMKWEVTFEDGTTQLMESLTIINPVLSCAVIKGSVKGYGCGMIGEFSGKASGTMDTRPEPVDENTSLKKKVLKFLKNNGWQLGGSWFGFGELRDDDGNRIASGGKGGKGSRLDLLPGCKSEFYN